MCLVAFLSIKSKRISLVKAKEGKYLLLKMIFNRVAVAVIVTNAVATHKQPTQRHCIDCFPEALTHCTQCV